jgi:hypothetical protein
MKERTPYRSAPSFGDVCQCIYEWSDDQLEELSDDDFEDLPCATCGGRVVDMPTPVWMEEEEDDC